MQTRLTDQHDLPPERVSLADSVLRRCVHCGFCNATCPTYGLEGNELDGPRGRIYLIKQALEGEAPTRVTQRHLDRCLTCMACETTCPSGVRYHDLLDVGRELVDARVRRPWREAALRTLLRFIVSRRPLFAAATAMARLARPLLPGELKRKVPPRAKAPARESAAARPAAPGAPAPAAAAAAAASARAQPTRTDTGEPTAKTGAVGSAVTLRGCVQPVLAPNTNAAASRVLARLGVTLEQIEGAGCCGALHFHFGDRRRALTLARRNVRALAAKLDAGADVVVSTASGCGAFVKDYGRLLAGDENTTMAADAVRVSDRLRDLGELLDAGGLRAAAIAATVPADESAPEYALHCPCTLQHGLRRAGELPALLTAAGLRLQEVPGPQRCCGSAGAYSILQPDFARRLGEGRAKQLQRARPDAILTANVGCQHHLQVYADVPVRHWVEVLDEHLAGQPSRSR